MGTTKLKSSAMAKKGVNYVRDIIESSNSIFHEVHQENDYGNDAFIELVEGEDVKGITLAVQVKSGSSFCTNSSCSIPASKQHFNYWKSHSLPVIGIVYDPNEELAYWINITNHLENNPEVLVNGPYTITFKKADFSRFTMSSFETLFKPIHLKKQIKLPIDKSITYLTSQNNTEHSLGLHVLLNLYCNELKAWEAILDAFRIRSINDLDPSIVFCMAHIPGHPDIYWGNGKSITTDVRSDLRVLISNFSEQDIVKLLSLLDEDELSFERGTLGQSAESIISLLIQKEEKLLSIINNFEYPIYVRDASVILFAYYKQEKAVPELVEITTNYPELTWASETATILKEEGSLYFY
ncbi:MAG: DUF4365 domain-containing protein [Paraglaciecola sp.]|uniref:DUF4365 domain-containing protein n=1 Tax=Paraglaciecola sp. TaxID=1920173 RepID=UPI003298A36C